MKAKSKPAKRAVKSVKPEEKPNAKPKAVKRKAKSAKTEKVKMQGKDKGQRAGKKKAALTNKKVASTKRKVQKVKSERKVKRRPQGRLEKSNSLDLSSLESTINCDETSDGALGHFVLRQRGGLR